ncbi:MAG: hypothetical protein JNL60_13075 [Bacteroidia bacterium]|nr:hypothetical protein [Bacteroidia bacterium]
MRKHILTFLLCASGLLALKGQNDPLLSSNAYIQTCIDQSQCFSINSSALLFYDEPKGAFFLKLELTKFKTGTDTLDDWLDDLGSEFLYLKVPIQKENFIGGLSNNNYKTFKINNASVLLNGIWHDEFLELTLSQAEPNNPLVPSPKSSGNDTYANIRATFSLVLSPKNYKVHRKAHNVKNTIYIGVHSGRINLIRDNMYTLLGEAYDHN